MQLYQQIEQCVEHQAPLQQAIASIYDTLLPKRKFRPSGLTHMQSLSLVYQHLRAPLNKLKQRIENQIKENSQVDNSQEQLQDEQSLERNEQIDQIQNQQNQGMQDEQENEQRQQQDPGEEEEENHDQKQMQDDGQDEEVAEDDVGIYGQQIDDEDMQSYENQNMGDDPQFGNFNLNKASNHLPKNLEDNQQDQYIQDNFDQFRQIQMQNAQKQKQQQPTQLEQQIQKLQDRAMKGKNWVLSGEIKAKQRPVNSLLDTELQFKSGIKYSHQINQNYNNNLQTIIKQRILDQIFDDRVRFIPNAPFGRRSKLEDVSTDKSSKGLAELYEIQFKNSLGIGDNKNQKLKKQIMDSFKQINYYLDSLSNAGFALKPTTKFQKNGAEAIVLQDKVPVTNWNGNIEISNVKHNFESDKQINKKAKRLKNKRNARQRKKEQDRKKTNRSIEYGGQTKYEVEARKKIAKSKSNAHSIKFNKSASFFKSINNKDKAGKPNPNISKLKI